MNSYMENLDPQIRPILERLLLRWGNRPAENISPAQRRDLTYLDLSYWNELDRLSDVEKSEHWVVGTTRQVRLARYRRKHGSPRSMLYWVHGGGWTTGSVETHEGIFHRLLKHADIEVVAPNYSLAPECPYPVAVDEVALGLEGILSGSTGKPVSPDKIVIGGDSAGAQIAACVTARRALRRQDMLRAQVLVYGAFYPRWDGPSHGQYGSGAYGLSSDAMQQSWQDYLQDDDRPELIPSQKTADLYPTTKLLSAEYDCLAQDTLEFEKALSALSIDVSHVLCKGMIHGFLHMGAGSEAADNAIANIARLVLT